MAETTKAAKVTKVMREYGIEVLGMSESLYRG